MKVIESIRKMYIVLGALASLLFFTTTGFAAMGGNSWQNEITIYGWYAGLDGTVQAPTGTESDFSVEASDILEDLELMLMAGYEGRYNRWSVIADFVYLDAGDSANIPTGAGPASVDLNVSSYLVNGGIGYDFVQSDNAVVGLVGGVRYLSLDVDYDASVKGMQLFSSSEAESITDAFVGLRGQVKFNDNWFMPYYADIGAGGSDLSYQLFTAIGYRFGWGDIRLGYRYLNFEMDEDKLMDNLELSGPVLGVGFRF